MSDGIYHGNCADGFGAVGWCGRRSAILTSTQASTMAAARRDWQRMW